jgi:hypothetical protein
VALITNPTILIQGFLRQAKSQPDPVAWLTEKHAEVLAAVAAGDTFVTSHSFSGQSGAEERGIPAETLLQIYEACLQQLEVETEEAEGTYKQPGHIRYADFSKHPCTLG